jgi:hypothetical protein
MVSMVAGRRGRGTVNNLKERDGLRMDRRKMGIYSQSQIRCNSKTSAVTTRYCPVHAADAACSFLLCPGNGGAWGVQTTFDGKGGTLPRMNTELRDGTATQARPKTGHNAAKKACAKQTDTTGDSFRLGCHRCPK